MIKYITWMLELLFTVAAVPESALHRLRATVEYPGHFPDI